MCLYSGAEWSGSDSGVVVVISTSEVMKKRCAGSPMITLTVANDILLIEFIYKSDHV